MLLFPCEFQSCMICQPTNLEGAEHTFSMHQGPSPEGHVAARVGPQLSMDLTQVDEAPMLNAGGRMTFSNHGGGSGGGSIL